MKDKSTWKRALIMLAVILVFGIIYMTSMQKTESVEVVKDDTRQMTASPADSTKTYIHICGEVKKPGVYEFSGKPRIIEVIDKAGGFTKSADQTCVNQAKFIEDGSQLVITKKNNKNKKSIKPQSDKINLNQATKEELMTLSGIGEAKAALIISYRESHGDFTSIEDIKKIQGIKDGVFNQIKELIQV